MAIRFLFGATMLAASADAASPSIAINATTVRSGDAVRVSWADVFAARGIDGGALAEHRTVWTGGQDHEKHTEVACTVVGDPTGSYWVGQFSPAVTSLADVVMSGDPIRGEGTPPYTTPAPNKFITGTQLANGAYTFIVTNMRASVNWVLFEGSLTDPSNFKPLALSPSVAFSDADRPMHGRLARTSSTDQMRVSWTTSPRHCTDCTVAWGTSATKLDRLSKAPVISTYAASDLCGMPANQSGFHPPGEFHSTVLNLTADPEASRLAGLLYFYKFGSDAAGWSDVDSFLAPKPANPHVAMSIIVTADMGETYEDGSQYHWEEPSAVNTTLGIATFFNGSTAADWVDMILHPGDLAYATGYESEWDRFMEQIEPVARKAPYMTGQGNHERDFPHSNSISIGSGDSGGECGVPIQGRFQMPACPEPNAEPCIGRISPTDGPDSATMAKWGGVSGPTGPQNDGWYSYDQGSVHVVMLNTEMSSLNGSRQHSFVAADLAAVDRTVTPWVFIVGHRQMYSGNMMTPANEMGDLEPLMMAHKVDIAFWGHIHFAQLSCPMYRAKCVTVKDAAGYDAPVHAVIGNAGQRVTSLPAKKAPWSVYNEGHWGFSHVTVSNATHLRLNFFNDAEAGSPNPLRQTLELVRAFPRV